MTSPEDSNPPKSTESNKVFKLFIGGLSWETNIESFREYFESICHSPVTDVTMPKNHNTGRQRGFGFIGFTSKKDHDMVLEMSQNKCLIIMGKNVEAKEATEQPPRKSFPPRPGMPRKRNMQSDYTQYGGGYNGGMQNRPLYNGSMPGGYYPGYDMQQLQRSYGTGGPMSYGQYGQGEHYNSGGSYGSARGNYGASGGSYGSYGGQMMQPGMGQGGMVPMGKRVPPQMGEGNTMPLEKISSPVINPTDKRTPVSYSRGPQVNESYNPGGIPGYGPQQRRQNEDNTAYNPF